VGANHEDPIGIGLKRDLNLRNSTLRGENAGELELAEVVVVLAQRMLTFKDLKIIVSRCET
jgi:hypothetical protein